MRLFLYLAKNLGVWRAIGKLEPAGGVYPDVVPEIVFVEIGEVDGGDIADGVIAQRGLAGKI